MSSGLSIIDKILKSEQLKKRIINIFKRKQIPDRDDYIITLQTTNDTLLREDTNIRPYSKYNLPGGLLVLKRNIPTIIVPDIHARIDFILNLLFFRDSDGYEIIDKLVLNKIQIVCIGDGFHSELRGAKRWRRALEEYKTDFRRHHNMDMEMIESLGVMEMIMEMKSNFPDNFHFLKGNHENITNERGNGNFPFRKYALEGPMVFRYMQKFYGNEFLSSYSEFEKNLPLFAIGSNFLISHAEPFAFYNENELIEYRDDPQLIQGLTWTDNEATEPGSVEKMLLYYHPNRSNTYYFGGHRPVSGLYNSRAEGNYIQIHNPSKFIIAYIKPDRDIDLTRDIIELNDNSKYLLNKY